MPAGADRLAPFHLAPFHLAQVNIGSFLAPPGHPDNAPFFDALDQINALADAAPGFVWRLVGDGSDATDIRVFDDPNVLINMSVWTDLASLSAFVYRSGHVEVMRRRHEWFASLSDYLALWWIPAGTLPDIADAKRALNLLAAHGPTLAAFTFRHPFPAPVAP